MTRWLIVSVVLTAAALGASVYIYTYRLEYLPEQVPVHWNIEGKPDRFVPRDDILMNFLLMPLVMAGVIVLGLVLPWVSPLHFKVEPFRPTWFYVITLVVTLMGYIHVAILWASLKSDRPIDLGSWLLGGIFLFFALIGNVIGKVKRNFWMGVRTPWTLASDVVWVKTHRLAGWLWVAAGLVGFVAVIAGVNSVWCFVGVMGAILYPVVYSLVLYKKLEKAGRLNDVSSPNQVTNEV